MIWFRPVKTYFYKVKAIGANEKTSAPTDFAPAAILDRQGNQSRCKLRLPSAVMPASTQPPSREIRGNTSDRKGHGAEQLRPEIDLRVDAHLEVFRSRRDLAGDLVERPSRLRLLSPCTTSNTHTIADSPGQRGFDIYGLEITWTLYKSELEYGSSLLVAACCRNCPREIRSCATFRR